MQTTELNPSSLTIYKLEEMGDLIHRIRPLMAESESRLLQESACQMPAVFAEQLELYCRNFTALHDMAQDGMRFLAKMRSHIQLSLDELTRLESEGGHAADKAQSAQITGLNQALRKVDLLMNSLRRTSEKESRKENA